MASLQASERTYRGPERRSVRVFLTQNSGYYCRGDTCTAVRDLRTGRLRQDHAAIGRRLAGGIRFLPDGRIDHFTQRGEEPQAGERIFFSNGTLGEELVTSELRDVARTGNALDRNWSGSGSWRPQRSAPGPPDSELFALPR